MKIILTNCWDGMGMRMGWIRIRRGENEMRKGE